MRCLFLSLVVIGFTWSTARAQGDYEYVFEYLQQYEQYSQEMGGIYSRFRTRFGTDPAEVQQARMDSLFLAADDLWKNHIKSMPAYKGDNSFAQGYKDIMKYIRGDFKNPCWQRKKTSFKHLKELLMRI